MTTTSVGNLSGPVELVKYFCDRHPDKPAVLSTDGDSFSYDQLLAQMTALVGGFYDMGLTGGDRIAAVLPDGAPAAVTMLALAEIGACCPLDPRLSGEEYAQRFALLRPSALVARRGTSSRARAAAAMAGMAIIDIGEDGTLASAGDPRRAPGTEPLPRGLLLSTSGSTGTPKFAMLPWPVMLAGAQASARAYHLTGADRRLNVMPLFHIQGMVGSVLASLAAGGSVLCAPGFTPAAVTRRWLGASVTWFSASPAMHQRILDAAGPRWHSSPALRFVRCGSAGLPGPLRDRLERFYRVPVVESYGMTEAHQIASTPLPPRTATGLVPTGSEVAIEVCPGMITTEPGRLGQVLVRGDNVIPGYLPADPGAFIAGWFRTGDQGQLADDGSLSLTGRIRELIIRGGENIAPREVEEALRAHPDVRDVCVAGVPDPVLGERVAAAVTLGRPGGTDAAALRSFAAARLAPFKVPELVLIHDELPETGPGKLAREKIARQLAAAADLARPGTAARPPAAAAPSRQDYPPCGAGPPGTAGEDTPAMVLCLWRTALGDTTLGPADDFFAAGGDSLAMTTLLTAVTERFGVEISPLVMFDEAPTAAAMARYIDASIRGAGVME